MPRHAKKYEAAGIDALRLMELIYICRQYRKMKQTLENARAGIVDRPHSANIAWRRPDPTGNAAVNVAAMPEARRVRLIEAAAAEVAPHAIARAILKSACDDVSYEKLRPRPPCGPNQFYDYRRSFFICLDGKLYADEIR